VGTLAVKWIKRIHTGDFGKHIVFSQNNEIINFHKTLVWPKIALTATCKYYHFSNDCHSSKRQIGYGDEIFRRLGRRKKLRELNPASISNEHKEFGKSHHS
jgi:hypothetical protein